MWVPDSEACGKASHCMGFWPGGPVCTMRCESHFKSCFGNVKAFNLKKIKIIAEPVAAMVGGGPAAGGRWQANSLGSS